MKKVILPLPNFDFDPTEVAVTWKVLSRMGIAVVFSTEEGKIAEADALMATGKGLGILAPLLMADQNGVSAYLEMKASAEFNQPVPWENLQVSQFDGIVLAGGHAPRMKQYLESSLLQNLVSDFFALKKPVGAICHGVVLAARSRSKSDPLKSCLYGYSTTCLLQSQELTAWSLTCLWLGNYYRTYPETVQAEVIRNLESKQAFSAGPMPLMRDSEGQLTAGYIVKDRNYVSARWPGDAHLFASELGKLILKS